MQKITVKKGQLKYWVETDERTDTTDRITFPANAVSNAALRSNSTSWESYRVMWLANRHSDCPKTQKKGIWIQTTNLSMSRPSFYFSLRHFYTDRFFRYVIVKSSIKAHPQTTLLVLADRETCKKIKNGRCKTAGPMTETHWFRLSFKSFMNAFLVTQTVQHYFNSRPETISF